MLKCYADYLFNIVITFCVKCKDAVHVCVCKVVTSLFNEWFLNIFFLEKIIFLWPLQFVSTL